jgi:hypothetical protein
MFQSTLDDAIRFLRSEVVGSSGHADRVKKKNTAKNIYPSR